MQMALAWTMRFWPVPAMWLTADDDLAKKASYRIASVFDRCPDMQGIRLPGRRNNKIYRINTLLSYLDISGAESSTTLEQEPYQVIMGDEPRKWPKGSLQKVKMRQRSYLDSKRAYFSTPDLWGDEFDEEFLLGNQFEFLFPCQGCGSMIPIVWSSQYSQLPEPWNAKSQTVFPAGTREIWLECTCNHRHFDTPATRRWILDHGDWMAMNTSANPEEFNPAIASFHWPAMLNPKVVWTEVAEIFRKAVMLHREHGLNEDLKVFVNESLGESWREGQQYDRAKTLHGSYSLEKARADNWDFVFLWIDVQEHYFWHVARGWKQDGSSRLLSWGKLLTWGDIIDKAEELKINRPSYVFLDSRFNREEVLDQCANHGWTAMRGEKQMRFRHEDGAHRLYSVPLRLDRGYDPEKKRRRFAVEVLYATWAAEEILQHYLEGKGQAFEVPKDMDELYQLQMQARLRVPDRNKKTGIDTWIWKDVGYRDKGPHSRDCEKGQIIAASTAGLISVALIESLTGEKS